MNLPDIGGAIQRAMNAVRGALGGVSPSPAPPTPPVPQAAPAAIVAPAQAAPAAPDLDDNFPACLTVILASEGGFVDNPRDPGGPTNLGVTIPALSAFLRKRCNVFDIRALTPETVAPLYRANYYNAAHCNELPHGLDLMVMDEAVNEGVGRAILHLQEALGVVADGMFGPATRAAVAASSVPVAINKLHDTNAAYYAGLDAALPQFERGWQSRNDRTRDIALTMVGR